MVEPKNEIVKLKSQLSPGFYKLVYILYDVNILLEGGLLLLFCSTNKVLNDFDQNIGLKKLARNTSSIRRFTLVIHLEK